jgi:hypothetical protein
LAKQQPKADASSRRDDANSALDALFWRDEVLQVLFWMRGEGLGDAPSTDQLATFLSADASKLHLHLERMVNEGFLTRSEGNGYALTERGRAEGGKLFMDEFTGLTNQAHGECNDPNCACKTQGPQACESREQVHV